MLTTLPKPGDTVEVWGRVWVVASPTAPFLGLDACWMKEQGAGAVSVAVTLEDLNINNATQKPKGARNE